MDHFLFSRDKHFTMDLADGLQIVDHVTYVVENPTDHTFQLQDHQVICDNAE